MMIFLRTLIEKHSAFLHEDDSNPRDAMRSMVGMEAVSEFNEEWLPEDTDEDDRSVFPSPPIVIEPLIPSFLQTLRQPPDP